MMGEHLLELDPEEDMVEAFACFDDGDKGFVDIKEMRKRLGELGGRMEDWEVRLLKSCTPRSSARVDHSQIDRLFSGPFTDRQGRFNYVEFAKVLRVKDGEEERDDKLVT